MEIDAFAYDAVAGIANASKHCRRNTGTFQHVAGTEREAEPFTVDHSEVGHDRLETPGLEISFNDRSAFVDACVREFLLAAKQAYPDNFADIDMAWLRE